MNDSLNIVLLAGGVGGAKLAHGLAKRLPADQLTIIGNTGDDFVHCGLTVCPDLDTLMYTLAELADAEKGWGRADESWRVMKSVRRLEGPDWFALGDSDLGVHLTRTAMLAEGESLTAVTRHLCTRLNVAVPILPMSNTPAPTKIETAAGDILDFQDWFVKQQWQPAVKSIVLPDEARATGPAVKAIENADVVILAPSNPFVSIDPILNAYPLRTTIQDVPPLVIAVSPIIGGQAVKGPAAKMMADLGVPVSAAGVAAYYGDLLDGFVYDEQDRGTVEAAFGGERLCTDTLMRTTADRVRLADDLLSFIQEQRAG